MIPPMNDGTTAVTIQRTFPATRERVFHAWTDREALQHWFRPEGRPIIINRLDVQKGGSFHFVLADGSDVLSGTYLEIIRPEKLVFTWSSLATNRTETVVTIDFIEVNPLTRVILTHTRFSNKEMCSLHQSGWLSLFNQLTTFFATV